MDKSSQPTSRSAGQPAELVAFVERLMRSEGKLPVGFLSWLWPTLRHHQPQQQRRQLTLVVDVVVVGGELRSNRTENDQRTKTYYLLTAN